MSAQKLNYYLVSGKIVIKKDDSYTEYPVNAVMHTQDGCIGEAELSKASILLQATFFKTFLDTENITVVNVFIYSISSLGKMTSERFKRESKLTPDEMAREAMLN